MEKGSCNKKGNPVRLRMPEMIEVQWGKDGEVYRKTNSKVGSLGIEDDSHCLKLLVSNYYEVLIVT